LDRVLKSPNPQEAEPIAAVPFHGSKQAGIATPAPEFLNFAAYDLTAISPVALRQLLGEWTDVAARLTTGETADQPARDLSRPPSDPGEVFGLGPAALTLTFGFGPALFEKRDLGLSSRSSPTLTPLPPFAGEALDSEVSDGDLCIQACAEDPQVAFHAIHVFTRIASGVATLRWSQQGFGRTSSTGRDQQTSRNLMGFKDGTNNVRADDESEMNEFVWVQPGDGPVWMEGGTYMVVRRIQMLLDVWDATSLDGQQRAVGREKVSGAPLGREGEYDPVDLEAKKNGELMIPVDAHIRLASPDLNGGQKILRRGFSYTEPSQAGSGQLDAGLFFISFQRDPQRQFVPIQQRLAAKDALSRHLLHTGTGVFACPPGVQSGGFIGEGLFA
jgi:deferrochelatase/peroxidase EfeB